MQEAFEQQVGDFAEPGSAPTKCPAEGRVRGTDKGVQCKHTERDSASNVQGL